MLWIINSIISVEALKSVSDPLAVLLLSKKLNTRDWEKQSVRKVASSTVTRCRQWPAHGCRKAT